MGKIFSKSFLARLSHPGLRMSLFKSGILWGMCWFHSSCSTSRWQLQPGKPLSGLPLCSFLNWETHIVTQCCQLTTWLLKCNLHGSPLEDHLEVSTYSECGSDGHALVCHVRSLICDFASGCDSSCLVLLIMPYMA